MKIYIFDFDTSIKEFYQNFFNTEFSKINVEFFHNLQEFLDKIQIEKPDLVITEFDIENPYFVFELLNKNQIPFILISHLFTERIVVESLKHGAYDFIYKKNLKYGYFKKVILRVLLDISRWNRINEILTTSNTEPQFSQVDSELKQISLQFSLTGEIEFPIPSFTEGKVYTLNFLTIKLIPVVDFYNIVLSEEDIQKYLIGILQKIKEIVQNYNGQIWIQKNDSFTAVFHNQDYLNPILASLQAQVFLVQFLSNWEFDLFKFTSCIEQGTVRYSKEKQNLYSNAINYTYHLVEKLDPKYKIYITETIYKNLDKRAKLYFFKNETLFENNIIYHFEYIA